MLRRQFDCAVFRSEFDRVSQQVHQDLLEPSAIGKDGQLGRSILNQRLKLLINKRLQCIADLLQKGCYRHTLQGQLQPSSFDLGKVQDIVDKLQKMLAAGVDMVDVALLALVQWSVSGIRQQVRKAQDGVQWGTQFVTHRREKLVFEPAGALNILFGAEDRNGIGLDLLLRRHKLGGTFLDALFQHLVGLMQAKLSPLDLRHHLVANASIRIGVPLPGPRPEFTRSK